MYPTGRKATSIFSNTLNRTRNFMYYIAHLLFFSREKFLTHNMHFFVSRPAHDFIIQNKIYGFNDMGFPSGTAVRNCHEPQLAYYCMKQHTD